MAKIVLTAENFAFGPIGKLLVVAELLKKKRAYAYICGVWNVFAASQKIPIRCNL